MGGSGQPIAVVGHCPLPRHCEVPAPWARVCEHLDDAPPHDVEVVETIALVASPLISGLHTGSLTALALQERTSFIVCGEVVTSPNVNTG